MSDHHEVAAHGFHVAMIPILTALVGNEALLVWGGRRADRDAHAASAGHYPSRAPSACSFRLVSTESRRLLDAVVVAAFPASEPPALLPPRGFSSLVNLRLLGSDGPPLPSDTPRHHLGGPRDDPICNSREGLEQHPTPRLAVDLSHRRPSTHRRSRAVAAALAALRAGDQVSGPARDPALAYVTLLACRFGLPTGVLTSWAKVCARAAAKFLAAAPLARCTT
jgi:hypothetical protein